MVRPLAIIGGIAALGSPGVFIGPLLASVVISALDLWPAVAALGGIPASRRRTCRWRRGGHLRFPCRPFSGDLPGPV